MQTEQYNAYVKLDVNLKSAAFQKRYLIRLTDFVEARNVFCKSHNFKNRCSYYVHVICSATLATLQNKDNTKFLDRN